MMARHKLNLIAKHFVLSVFSVFSVVKLPTTAVPRIACGAHHDAVLVSLAPIACGAQRDAALIFLSTA